MNRDKSTGVWLPVTISSLAVVLMLLSVGWTQIIEMVQGKYGHTITDGASGFTITGSTTADHLAVDTLCDNNMIVGDSTYVAIFPGCKMSGNTPLGWNPVPFQVFWDNTYSSSSQGRTYNNIILRPAYSQLTGDGYKESNIVIQSGKVFIEALSWYNQGLDVPGEVTISVGPSQVDYNFAVGGLTAGAPIYTTGSITADNGGYIGGTTAVNYINFDYSGLSVGHIGNGDWTSPWLVQYKYDENWATIIDSTYYGTNSKTDTLTATVFRRVQINMGPLTITPQNGAIGSNWTPYDGGYSTAANGNYIFFYPPGRAEIMSHNPTTAVLDSVKIYAQFANTDDSITVSIYAMDANGLNPNKRSPRTRGLANTSWGWTTAMPETVDIARADSTYYLWIDSKGANDTRYVGKIKTYWTLTY